MAKSNARRTAAAAAGSAVAALTMALPATASANEVCVTCDGDKLHPPQLAVNNAFIKVEDLQANGLLLPAVQQLAAKSYPGATGYLFHK